MTTKNLGKQRVIDFFLYILISSWGVFTLLPFVWPVLSAFSPPPVSLFVKIPDRLTLTNFQNAIGPRGDALQSLGNSMIYAFASLILVVIICTLGGYTLSRAKFRFKRLLMFSILTLEVIPLTATILPYYLLMTQMKLVDTYLGVILGLSTAQIPFMLWVMKGFFDSVPFELEEAAWLDGASRFQALFRVVLPLALPGLGAGAVLTFNSVWGAFFLPLIVISSRSKIPISIAIYRAVVGFNITDYGMMNATSMLYMVPSLLVFLFARQYLIRGTSAGAMAGE